MNNLPDDDSQFIAIPSPSRSDGEPAGPNTVLVFCKKCQRDTYPSVKGLCSVCGIFLPKNTVNPKRNPDNPRRKEQLLAAVIEEYQPSTVIDKATCAQLAAAIEQLERVSPGSMPWQRMVDAVQKLRATLSKPEAPAPSAYPALRQMPLTLLTLLHGLLTRQEAGEPLTERELGQLDLLKMAVERGLDIPWPDLEHIQ